MMATLALLATVELQWPAIIAGVAVYLLTNAITWLIAARVTTAVLSEQNRHLAESQVSLVRDVRDLTGTVHTLTAEVASVRQERMECQLHAVQSFATKEDFVYTMAEAVAGTRQLSDQVSQAVTGFRTSVSKAHGRVDEILSRVVRLETQAETRGVTSVTG